MGRHPDAAVVGRDRLGPGRGVGAQVAHRDPAAGGREPARLALGDVALVEVVEPGRGEALERRRERRHPDDLAGPPAPAVRPEDLLEPGPGAHDGLDRRERRLDRRDEPRPRREAVARELDRGREHLRPRQAPEPRVRVAPRSDGARDRDRERPAERQRLQPEIADRRRIGRRGRPPGAVQPVELPRASPPRPARTRRRRSRSSTARRPRARRSSRSPRRPRSRPPGGCRAPPRSRDGAARRRRPRRPRASDAGTSTGPRARAPGDVTAPAPRRSS